MALSTLAGRLGIRISASPDRESLALLQQLKDKPKEMTRVIVRAINRTLVTARTQLTRQIAQHVNLKIRDLRRSDNRSSRGTVKTINAVQNRPQGELYIDNRTVPLFRFGARGSKRKGVSFQFIKGGKRYRAPKAFIGRGRAGDAKSAAEATSGHKAVFERVKGVPRKPIFERMGPSLSRILRNNPQIRKQLSVDVADALQKNIKQQVRFAMRTRTNRYERQIAATNEIGEA